MHADTIIDALRKCLTTYAQTSITQQLVIAEKDKDIKKLTLRVEKLEKIITNNIKNGSSFL